MNTNTGKREAAYTTQDDDEVIIKLKNGAELRGPVYPRECDYVRVVKANEELGYWSVDEWRDDPADVMGALLGLLNNPRKV